MEFNDPAKPPSLKHSNEAALRLYEQLEPDYKDRSIAFIKTCLGHQRLKHVKPYSPETLKLRELQFNFDIFGYAFGEEDIKPPEDAPTVIYTDRAIYKK